MLCTRTILPIQRTLYLRASSSLVARSRFVSTEATHFEDTKLDRKPEDSAVAKIRVLDHDVSRAHENWTMSHPTYTPEELHSIKVVKRQNQTISDSIAAGLVKMARTCFDLATGYRHYTVESADKAAKKLGKPNLSVTELREAGLLMTEKQWLARAIFLESIAGVPGMAASVLRHLRSMRSLKRDHGWIKTLLTEAENERMHLLCFLKIRQPGLFMRACIIGAQGVFFNAFFFTYLLSPRACHRFVGKLEEEAVYTYSTMIEEIEAGRLPEWDGVAAPAIAIDYWRLKKDATLLDMIYAIRADESNHRFTNHTLANLKADDVNPFAIKETAVSVRGGEAELSREQALKWAAESESEARALLEKNQKQW